MKERPPHGIFFEFTAASPESARIYNRVIEDVLSKVGSPTPHGTFAEGKGNQPGYQNWQIETIDIKQANELVKTINELAREFFIEENKNIRKEQLMEDFNSSYWESKFAITREVPFFLSKLSEKVLTCGKYLSLLKECGQRVDKRIVDRINFADGKALSIIEEAHNHASKQVLNYFL